MNVRTITRLPRPQPKQAQLALQERLLWCDICGTWTRHALTMDGSCYVCGCGDVIIYYRNENPAIL